MFLTRRRFEIAIVLSALVTFATSLAVPLPASALIVEEFTFRSIDGRSISSEDVRGQIVVFAIGASWMPLSRKQGEGLRKLANEYARQGVVVYFVATDSDSPKSKTYATDAQLASFAKRNAFNLTVLRDPEGVVSKQFGVDQIPAFVILDKQGNVVGSPIGGLDADGDVIGQLAPQLDKVL